MDINSKFLVTRGDQLFVKVVSEIKNIQKKILVLTLDLVCRWKYFNPIVINNAQSCDFYYQIRLDQRQYLIYKMRIFLKQRPLILPLWKTPESLRKLIITISIRDNDRFDQIGGSDVRSTLTVVWLLRGKFLLWPLGPYWISQ